MNQFQNLMDEFNEAISELASTWREQQAGFTDKKIEQFGDQVLRPISDAGAKINAEAEELKSVIQRLKNLGFEL